MTITTVAHINLRGTARAALEFYRSVFGGELGISTFGEFHASEDPAEVDLVMHGQLTTPGGLVLMASDTPASMELSPGSSVSVSLSGEDMAELSGYWEKLAVGATITAPFGTAPWGDTFGMLVDAFGTAWLVNVIAPTE